MKILKDNKDLQKVRAQLHHQKKTLGFVPTMGALHEGHLSLVRKSHQENDVTIVSIFVNPTQFGPKEDLEKYPRPLERDLQQLRKEKVDFVFLPTAKEMYPEGYASALRKVRMDRMTRVMSRRLCGKFRPGHFKGVLCVVEKLFKGVRPQRTYFGAKDFQQAALIVRMNLKWDFGIQMRVMPTLRENDGLAMSSRNIYLSREERSRARSISQTLFWMSHEILKGKRGLLRVRSEAMKKLKRFVDKVQYLEIVEPEELKPIRFRKPDMVILTACYVGKTRLIDNVIIHSSRE